jgi:hypothetical protein
MEEEGKQGKMLGGDWRTWKMGLERVFQGMRWRRTSCCLGPAQGSGTGNATLQCQSGREEKHLRKRVLQRARHPPYAGVVSVLLTNPVEGSKPSKES